MNIEILIPDDFESYSDVKKEKMCLSCYELLEYMQQVNDKYNFHDKDKICEYIGYGKIKNDQEKQLLKYLNKSVTSDKSKESISNNIQNNICDEYISICIDIRNNLNNSCFINSKDKLIELKCNCYLKKIKKDNFIKYCSNIFDKLCYSDTVGQSLNSISKYIKKSKDKILKHLQVLSSDDFDNKKRKKKRLIDIGDLLKEYNISCSVSSDRNSVQSFYFTCKDNVSKKIECELHTKLDSNRDSCIRIHFHPGMKDFCNNKVLIGYIGEHL